MTAAPALRHMPTSQLNKKAASKLELVEIRSALFPRLYEAFLHDDDPLSDESDWRNVFDYQWEKDEDHTGYALLKDGQVIGMMAMAFSSRLINGERHKFCNLHTWWVHPDHRGHSTAMLRPILGLNDYTITHFTPCARVRALLKRLGFVDLDLQMKLLLPHWPFSKSRLCSNAQITFDDAIDLSLLDDEERRLFVDHRPYRVGSLLLREDGEHCAILYTCVERYRVRYCHIHFIGAKAIFARHEEAVRSALMQRHGVRLVVVDTRLVQKLCFRRSMDFWAPAHAVYRPSGGVSPSQVDNLYSDVVMLRLAIMPHLSHEIGEIIRRWLPFKKGSSA